MEVENLKSLLQASEQARNDLRKNLTEVTENVKSAEEKERATQRMIIDENTSLREASAKLKEL